MPLTIICAETFTSILSCTTVNGKTVHSFFNSVECWTGLHILHATFAILISAIFIVISMVVALTYYESKSKSNDPSARQNSRADIFVLSVKIILNYLFTFFTKDEYIWFLITVLVTLSTITYLKFRYGWPYYNEKVSKVFNMTTGLFSWTSWVLLLAKLLENTDFNGALQIYFLGIPLVILMILSSKDERIKLLLKNINKFQKGEEVQLQIRYYLHLVHTKDTNRNSAIILKGYLYNHVEGCQEPDCCLKTYKSNITNAIKGKKNTQSKK